MHSDGLDATTSRRGRASLLALVLAGCSTLLGVEDTVVHGACTTEAECAPGYGCLLNACRNQCTSDQECGEGSRCLRYGLTAACIPAQADCGEGCPEGATSCVAGVCRTNCESDDDCAGGQACRQGSCVGTDAAHDVPGSVGGASGAGNEPNAGEAGIGATTQGGVAGSAGSAGIAGVTGGAGMDAGGEGGGPLNMTPHCEPECGDETPVCLDGTCVACEPSNQPSRCSAQDVPQRCNEAGAWQDADACKENEVCTAGTCECPGEVCGSACKDTQSDPDNCGSCGHECAVGGCESGACTPVELATGLSSPKGIAVAGGKLFWVAGNTLTSLTLSTMQSAPMALAAANYSCDGALSGQVVANATWVYWQAYHVCQINHSIANGSAQRTSSTNMYGGASGVQALATGGGHVFAVEPGEYMLRSSDGSSFWYFFGGGGGQVPAVAADATHVYWLQGKGAGLTFVYKHTSPKLTDAPIEIASGQDPGEGIGVYDGYVYWTSSTSKTEATGKVSRVSVNGGAVSTLASNQLNPSGLIVDSSGVYWTNRHSAGSVMRIPHAGGEPVPLATSQNGANGIIADSTRVYWTDTEGGKVMMVSK